mgnify:CR=1 FL=1
MLSPSPAGSLPRLAMAARVPCAGSLLAAAAAVVVFTALRLPETRRETFWDNHRSRTKNHTIAGLGPAEEGAWRGSFHFVQLADPQLGMLNSDQEDGKWEEETATLTKAVEHINRLKPKFAIVCGDLVHEFPEGVGEKGNDRRKAGQTRSLQSALSRVDSSIGLVCLCGNHDVGNVPSRKSMRDFRNNYGEDYGLFRCGDHRCVVINSQLVNSKEKFWQGLRKEQCDEIRPMAEQQDLSLIHI